MAERLRRASEFPNLLFRSFHRDAIFHRVLVNSGWLVGANGITAGLGLVQNVLLARELGVEQYGTLGLVVAFVTILKQLMSFRMNEFVVKFAGDALAARCDDQASAIFKFALLAESAASTGAFIIALALAPLGAQLFIRSPNAEFMIRAYGIVIIGALVSETSTGILQLLNRFRIQSLSAVAGKSVSFVLVVLTFLLHAGLLATLLAILTGNLVSNSILIFSALREVQIRMGKKWWRIPMHSLSGNWRTLWKFAISTNLSATLSMLVKESDVLWLGYFRNPSEVGYYKLAVNLVSIFSMPISPLTQAIYPEIAREAASRKWSAFNRLLSKTSLMASAYIGPVVLLFCLFAAWIIEFLYGREFAPVLPAAIILIAGLAFPNIVFWARPALLALGCADYALKINLWTTGIKIAGSLIVLPLFGYVGNAALMAFLNGFGVTLAIHKIRKLAA